MFLDILRDGLGDELTTDDISQREVALDKEIIQLIQSACKSDQLSRAIDLAKLFHHTGSFDMAIKLAGFYHLVGLQEKFEALKDDREDVDRLEVARDKRRELASEFTAVPAPRVPVSETRPSLPKLFQDFNPPPALPRPGLERATPAPVYRPPTRPPRGGLPSRVAESDDFQSSGAVSDWDIEASSYDTAQDGKRKRSEEPGVDVENSAKRRAFDDQTLLGQLDTNMVEPAGSALGQPSRFCHC